MSKHTPGPWALNALLMEHTDQLEVASAQVDGPHIASVTVTGKGNSRSIKPEQLANAHLIAAAPELLAVLQEAFRAFSHDDDGPVWADSTIAKARAAIAKATGKAA